MTNNWNLPNKHVVHGAMSCGQKKLSVSVAVPPAPVQVPSQRPLAPSVASVISVANDKGYNEMILGAVHRSPGICLTAEENPQKISAGRPSDEGAVRPVIASNGVPFSQISSYTNLSLYWVEFDIDPRVFISHIVH